MSNQFLKLRRSAVPGKIPDPGSLALGEIALNTYDGLAFMKKDGINGEEIVIIGDSSGSFTGSFSGEFTGSLLGTASYASTVGGGLASYIPLWGTNTSLTSSFLNQTGSVIKGIYQGITKGIDLDFALGSYTLGNPGTGNSTQLQVFDTAGVINVYTPNYTYFDEKVGIRITPTNPGLAVSGSLEVTGPGTSKFMNTNVQITGSLTVSDTITAQRLVVQTISSSIIYSSGSNIFGDDLGDTQQFTGSVTVTGSFAVNGPSTFNGRVTANNLTGSLYGTSSWATTASFALSGNGSFSGSFSGSVANIDGQTNFIAKFDSPNSVDSSVIYQSASHIAINETNFTTDNPEALYVFQTHPTSINVLTGKGNLNNYLQNNIQNTNQGISASSDVVATANNGNENTNYIDMGINSENFNTGFIGGANDAYLYSIANNLHIGNANDNGTHLGFFVGGDDVELFNKLQLNPNNRHTMSGSLGLTGSLNVKEGITGSLFGTSSWAVSASKALSGNGGFSGSFTGSFFGNGAGLTNISASAVVGLNLSLIGSGSVTASTDPAYGFRVNSNTQISGSTRITGSLGVTGSFSLSGSLGSLFSVNVDTMVFTGSIFQSGSIIVTGSVNVLGGVTASLFGTASYATQALTASNANTASYVLNAISSSFASTASFVANAQTASYVLNAVSASFASTASYINPLNQLVIITGSLIQGLEGNIATGDYSHAEGSITKAIGNYSHAEGDFTQAKGDYSHAEGQETIASGSYSHAEGYQTIALANHQHVQGQFNAVSSVPSAFIVGNGTDDGNRSNLIYAHDSTVEITGSLEVNGGITGSLQGTASWAVSASHAPSALTSSNAVSASYAITSSYTFNAATASTADNFVVRQDITASNALIYGTLTAQTIYAQYITASTELITGSTQFGTQLTDTHQFTGSVTITGSLSLNNDPVVTQSPYNQFSQSIQYRATELEATASILTNASASLAIDSGSNSTRLTNLETTASTLTTASASFALVSASYSQFSQSYNTGSFTGSFTGYLFGTSSWAVSASYAPQSISASYALTASNVNPLVQNVQITGSLNLSGSQTFVGTSTSTGTQIVTGSLVTSGSNTLIGNTFLTGSVNITGSTTQIGSNTLLGNTTLSGSIIMSGSLGSTPTVKIYGDTQHNGYIRFDPVTTNIDQSISASYIYVSGSTNDLYFSQNGNGYANTTRLRWLEGNLYTGLLNGGLITTQSSTVYQISSGSGIIVNLNASLNDNPYPTVQYLNWGNLSASIAPLTASYQQAFVSIDSSGNIYQQGTPYAAGQFDTEINIGVVLFQNQSTINGVKTQPSTAYGFEQNQNIFNRAFGPLKLSGYTLAPSGSSTGSLIVASGTAYSPGSNYPIDPNNPSYTTDSGTNVSKIFRYRQSGSTWVYDTNAGLGYGAIDPTQYSDNGVLTAVPGGGSNREFSIQRVFYFPNSVAKAIVVYYGNATYASLTDATSNIAFEPFVEAPNTAANAIYLGAIIVRNDADFTVTDSYAIQAGGLFRSVGGSGGGGSIITQTLSGLSDVNISGPTDLQPLAYSTTQTKWINTSTLNASITGNAATATSASYALTASYVENAQTSSYILNAVSASYAATASSADNLLVRQDVTASNALITGTITAQTLVVQTVTSSVVYSSGSNIFGNDLSNTQKFTGSVTITGSLSLNDSPVITDTIFNPYSSSVSTRLTNVESTASVLTTASASFALVSASYSQFSQSYNTGSFTGSFIGTLFGTASWANNATTASFVLNAVSSSFATSASFATTASFAASATVFPFTGSAIISSSLTVIGANAVSGNSQITGSLGVSGSVDFAYISGVAAWSAGGAMITARLALAGAGTQNAALAFGGTYFEATCTEAYNGTSWSARSAIITCRRSIAGAGTQNAALAFGGRCHSPSITLLSCTEAYNGTSWSAGGAMITARCELAGAGTQNAALAFGAPTCTEEYDGTTWSAGGAMITARSNLAGAGTQNEALAFGGPGSSCTEEYNGSTWASGGALITARATLAGAGTQNEALAFGGTPSGTCTEAYNGTSWSARTALISSRQSLGGAGTQNAALAFGGFAVPGFFAVSSTEAYGFPIIRTFNYSNTTGNTQITGSTVATGSLNIIGTSLITGSAIISSSLTTIGTNIISGSSTITGSLVVTGSIRASQGVTASLFGTASVSVTSSFATTASFATSSSFATTASFVLNVVSASFAATASIATSASFAQSASVANQATTASYVLQAVSASYALTSSNVQGGLATYIPLWDTNTSLSSSYLNQSGSILKTIYNGTDRGLTLNYNFDSYILGNPGVGNNTYLQVFDGGSVINVYSPSYTYFNDKVGVRIIPTNPGLAVSGSLEVTGPGTTKFINTDVEVTGSLNAPIITGSLFGTSSWAENAITASYVLNAVSSSFALTASYALNAGAGGVSAIYIADEGVLQGTASYFDFVGDSVTVTVSNDTASINIGQAVSASYAATASTAVNFNITNTLTFNGTLTDYATVNSSVVGSNNLFTQASGSYTSAFFKYTAANDANARTGEVMAVWNAATVQFTDNSTLDVGSTTPVTCSVAVVGTDVQFNVQTNTSGWRIKSIATFM